MKLFAAAVLLFLWSQHVLIAAPPAAKAVTFKGEMAPIKDDEKPGTKRFEVTIIVPSTLANNKEATSILWTTKAQGRGSHPWLLRFGQWKHQPQVDESRPPIDQGLDQPYLHYEHQTGKSFVPLLFPFFNTPDPLQIGTQWSVGRVGYQVMQEERDATGPTWRIEGKGPASLRRNIHLDKENHLIHTLAEKLFLGQGHEQELNYQITDITELSADELQALQTLFQELGEMRSDLGLGDAETVVSLQPKSLDPLREPVESLLKRAQGTLLEELLTDANRDLRNQRDQAGALVALKQAILLKPVPQVTTKDLSGKEVTTESLLGKVTILHFWEYRDVPLEQPYGQVAYLDFLLRKWKDQPQADQVQILGVHVDPDLASEETYRSATARAKRLKNFMNLGFPILMDEGEWLKKIGDPRPVGGRLPLFLVLDQQGKVVEYHPDVYPVKGQEGLVELEEIVNKLLKTTKP